MSHERNGTGEVSGHVSYLLRLWRERGRASTWWRASLQDPLSGERVGFAHLEDLVAFLREQTGPAPPAEDSVDSEGTPKKNPISEEGESE